MTTLMSISIIFISSPRAAETLEFHVETDVKESSRLVVQAGVHQNISTHSSIMWLFAYRQNEKPAKHVLANCEGCQHHDKGQIHNRKDLYLL